MPGRAVWTGVVALGVVASTVGAGLLLSNDSRLLSNDKSALTSDTFGSAPTTTSPPTTTAPPPTSAQATTAPRPTVPPGLTDISVTELAAGALPGQESSIQASRDEGAHIGAIEIPKIDLLHYMYEGVQLTTLDQGPGHWPGTPLPGQAGNTVVAGHRTSMNAAFGDLDKLEPGDEVIFQTEDGAYTYEVESTEIVDPSALWIADQTEEATATLFACHPKGSVSQRIVVRLELQA